MKSATASRRATSSIYGLRPRFSWMTRTAGSFVSSAGRTKPSAADAAKIKAPINAQYGEQDTTSRREIGVRALSTMAVFDRLSGRDPIPWLDRFRTRRRQFVVQRAA